MPSQKKRSFAITPSGITRNVENAIHESEKHDEDEQITARKADMLLGRQSELDNLMDSHDDLVCSLPLIYEAMRPFPHLFADQVREAFQLDKFVTLLSYDPKARVCGFVLTLHVCLTVIT